MNSKTKGDLAVAQAILYFTKRNEQVLIPMGDKQKYDLVIDRSGTFLKVQCKYTSFKTKYGIYIVPVCVCGGNQSYHTTVTYKKDDFDILFVYTSDNHMYEIPSEISSKYKKSIALGEKFKPYKIHLL